MTLKIDAPPFLVQLFFKATFESDGWSESYWIQGEDYNDALEKVTADDGLVDVRRGLFSTASRLLYVRVSDSNKLRDTKIKYLTSTTGGGTYTPTTGDQLPAEAAVLCRFESTIAGDPYFVLKPLRGIPYEVAPDGVYNPPAAWTTAFGGFENWLKDNADIVVNVNGAPTSSAIEAVLPTHMSHRKVGRFFGLSVGRSRLP